jgi:hypothetical protein
MNCEWITPRGAVHYFHAKNNYYFLKKVAEKFGGLK